jgi:hypothetical protein
MDPVPARTPATANRRPRPWPNRQTDQTAPHCGPSTVYETASADTREARNSPGLARRPAADRCFDREQQRRERSRPRLDLLKTSTAGHHCRIAVMRQPSIAPRMLSQLVRSSMAFEFTRDFRFDPSRRLLTFS